MPLEAMPDVLAAGARLLAAMRPGAWRAFYNRRMFPLDLLSSSAPVAAPASPLLADLNEEQLAAVTLPAGHALILALSLIHI